QFKNEGQSFTLEVTSTSAKTFDTFFPIKGEF
ncbi:competence type IV pilus minor pilin ComGF, partial [Enterococcus faecalis]